MKGAQAVARRVLVSLALPALTEARAARARTGYLFVYSETARGLPIFGAGATVGVQEGQEVQIDLRLYLASGDGPPQAILSADEAIATFVASGGASDIRSISLGYPSPAVRGKASHVAPVWRIRTGTGTVNVNAYTGEAAP